VFVLQTLKYKICFFKGNCDGHVVVLVYVCGYVCMYVCVCTCVCMIHYTRNITETTNPLCRHVIRRVLQLLRRSK
jgi:hypothetical protein